MKSRFIMLARQLRRQTEAQIPGLTAEEAVRGFLFHIAPGFRRGVSGMIAGELMATLDHRDVYVPAMEVGSASERPN